MRLMAGGALMLAAALVQVTLAPKLAVYGAFPNLVLVAVVCVTWTLGERAALAWACVGGLLLDLTAPGPLGPHALALLAAAYLMGFWVRNLDPANPLQTALAAAAATGVYSLVLVGVDDMLGLPVPGAVVAIQLATAAAAYNAVLAPPVLLVTRRLRPGAPA